MGDDHIVISSGQAVTPETVVNRSFASAFRGYHPAEVRQFLKRVSEEMADAVGREEELRRHLQEALDRAAHPDLDEATLTNLLGEHAAKLLASARNTAAAVVGDARQQADVLLRDAEQRMALMRHEAEGLMASRVAEADATAASILEAARTEAEAQILSATQQGKDMVAEARSVRERMLGDLARRRRSAQVQVEQLRAARERLLAAYDVVRRTVEEATAELEASEPEARMAAEAVALHGQESTGHRGEVAPPLVRPVPRVPAAAPPEPQRAMSPVGTASAPPVREHRQTPGLATTVFRRIEEKPSSAPGRPPLRPQTVAGAVAERTALAPPAPETPPTPETPPFPPPSDPPPANGSALGPPSSSELATSEVPAVTGDAPPRVVDELFARLRAGRDLPVIEQLRTGLSDPIPEPVTSAPERPAVDPVGGENALDRRDDLLESLEAGLTRALKRVLGDEQNEVLDNLRRLGAKADVGVLPETDEQTAGYRDAALPWLQQAVRAGIGFASDPASGSDTEAAHSSLDAQAQALAQELVGPLRERLSRALSVGTDGEDPAVVAESLRATYRQWKVQQIEECARHHVLTAFSVGAFTATPDAATLQWLVDDDGHCPDCDDNALAGPTPKGQTFPTGQLHPPAHRGCRCLLVPVTA